MPTSHQSALYGIAVAAAREAGALIRDGIHADNESLNIELKGAVDLVTTVDRAAEAVIVQRLQTAFPEHAILAEEAGGEAVSCGYQWLIDPLDGTTNFAHRHPQCAVSIACLRDGEPLLGVVFDPFRDELFGAQRGTGATLNGRPIEVSHEGRLEGSLLATGFAYDRRERADRYVPLFEAFLRTAQGVRRMGSASLDLVWLACGRLDGFWESGLSSWDVAAGVLIVAEAGGLVTDYAGEPLAILRPRTIVATNTVVHDEVLAVLSDNDIYWKSSARDAKLARDAL